MQIRYFLSPLIYLTPHGGEPCQNFLTIFGTEKLEWRGYQVVKNFKIGLDTACDRQTDRPTPHDDIDRAIHSVARVNSYMLM